MKKPSYIGIPSSRAYKKFFKTLGNINRLKIIKFLASEGPKNVSEITQGTRLEQSAVSHNLARLEFCHFVEVEQNGRERIYRLNEETIKPLLRLMDGHVNTYCVHCERCRREFIHE